MNYSLTVAELLRAYRSGYFPMDVDGQLRWFNPAPRAVIELDEFHVSRSLRRKLNRQDFEIRIDHGFEAVMRACAEGREAWISEELIAAYVGLHRAGHAHSLECWRQGALVGGVYGVCVGGVFCGESMFSRVTDASKVALYHLVTRLDRRGFDLLDVQFMTPHLASLGAIEIPRISYLLRLWKASASRRRFV